MTEEQNTENTGSEEEGILKGDEKDLQRIQSWLGRVEKTASDSQKNYEALTQKIDALSNNKPQFGDDEQAKFNEKLHEMVLGGDVMGALNLANKVKEEAQSQIKRADQTAFNAALEGLSEDPVMKHEELSKKVTESALSLMQQGLPAKIAVNHAKTLVENEALRSIAESGRPGSLEMLGGGGGKPAPTPEAKLPPGAEKAYQAGKEKGYFKDRKEYIANLDPRVRKEWGLEE